MSKVEDYARTLADLMELRDWRITVGDEPCDGQFAAQIQCVYGRKRARIRLCAEWDDRTPDQQRQNLVHELLHCHMRLCESLAEQAEHLMKGGAYQVWYINHEHGIEYAVDAIADALAPHLPLPPDEATKDAT